MKTIVKLTEAKEGLLDLKLGKSYLCMNKNYNALVKQVDSFSSRGFFNLFITRNESVLYNKSSESSIIFMEAVTTKEHSSANSFEGIMVNIKEVIHNHSPTIILINRLEYLSIKYGFNPLMKFLYELNDIIKVSQNILLLHINKNSFTREQLEVIKDEFDYFSKNEEEFYLDSNLIGILKLVAQKNSMRANVHFKEVKDEFRISKKTTKKRIEELERQKLIRIEQKGRKKIIYLTEKGKEMV